MPMLLHHCAMGLHFGRGIRVLALPHHGCMIHALHSGVAGVACVACVALLRSRSRTCLLMLRMAGMGVARRRRLGDGRHGDAKRESANNILHGEFLRKRCRAFERGDAQAVFGGGVPGIGARPGMGRASPATGSAAALATIASGGGATTGRALQVPPQ